MSSLACSRMICVEPEERSTAFQLAANDLFVEDVDFAILDNQNKERFLQNKPYISYYNVDEKFLQGKIGTMDFIETKDVPKYACFKNNNKSTKVYFGIRFFAINKQNQNFDSF